MGSIIKTLLVIVLLVPLVSIADDIDIKGTAPHTYTVKKGDTLWDISSLYLDKPWLWPELWRNNVHIKNPHLIYPGDQLRLRYNEQGEPVLEMVRETQKAEIKLTPQGRMEKKSVNPIPALPWSIIQPYVDNGLVMDKSDYEKLPHLLGNHDGAVRFATGDLVLSRANNTTPESYRIIRQQNEIRDSEGNLLGIQIRHVADAKPLKSEVEGQHLVSVKQANFEAKRGDKLLPDVEEEPQQLELEAATTQQGQIVDSLEQHQLLGKYNVVVLDLGDQDVSAGTTMGIYLQGPKIFDSENPKYDVESGIVKSTFDNANEVQQPAIKVGELVVFKVFDKASYALITRSTKVIKNGALVAKP